MTKQDNDRQIEFLLVTSSTDLTSDYITTHFPRAMRINVDLAEHYLLNWNTTGLSIKDPLGRHLECNAATVPPIWWRKPTIVDFGTGYVEDQRARFRREEFTETMAELFRLCRASDRVLGDTTSCDIGPNKILQSLAAERWFRVPTWELLINGSCSFQGEIVIKRLCGRSVATSSVEDDDYIGPLTKHYSHFRPELSGIPALVQQYIKATHDITTFWCHGKHASYARGKSQDSGIDWRTEELGSGDPWLECSLTDFGISKDHLASYLSCLGLDYGRFDWVLDEEGELWFLEINSNGQFAWFSQRMDSAVLLAMQEGIRQKLDTIE